MILALYWVERDGTFSIGGSRFGFVDYTGGMGPPDEYHFTILEAGPLGSYRVRFSAATGWALSALLLLAVLSVAAWGLRRKRRHA